MTTLAIIAGIAVYLQIGLLFQRANPKIWLETDTYDWKRWVCFPISCILEIDGTLASTQRADEKQLYSVFMNLLWPVKVLWCLPLAPLALIIRARRKNAIEKEHVRIEMEKKPMERLKALIVREAQLQIDLDAVRDERTKLQTELQQELEAIQAVIDTVADRA